jgi:predicted nucleic acid-binding protein
VSVGAERKPRLLLDAMVLVAGLTSRREPASYSRRLIELILDGRVDFVVTEILLRETYEVLIDPKFVGRVTEPEAATLVGGLAAVATVFVRDTDVEYDRITNDPNDDYLAHAALLTGAYLVTRDEAAQFGRVQDLQVGRPGTALRMIGAFDDEVPG